MSDEALRALEKKWREVAEHQQSIADDAGLSEGEHGWHSARSEQAEECADELATLIAELGQEVGAVDPVEADNAKAADRAALAMIGKGYYWNGDDWVLSPAHTSEARDAGMANWIRDAVDALNAVTTSDFGGPRLRDINGRNWWDLQNELLQAVPDAAMRQEAE